MAASSVAFLEMLNWNTVGLRIDLKIAQIILEYLNKQMPDMDIPQDKEVAEKTNRKEIGDSNTHIFNRRNESDT